MTEVMDNAMNEAFQRQLSGGADKLSERALTALGYAANCIQQDHWLGNGETAVYWHLVGVAASHVTGKREVAVKRDGASLTVAFAKALDAYKQAIWDRAIADVSEDSKPATIGKLDGRVSKARRAVMSAAGDLASR